MTQRNASAMAVPTFSHAEQIGNDYTVSNAFHLSDLCIYLISD